MPETSNATSKSIASQSEMRRRFGEHDWSSTPLGPYDTWSNALKVTLNTMLASPVPTFVVWAAGSIHLYNDAFISTIGARHPEAFGQPFDKVWGKVWSGATEMIQSALAGTPSDFEDARLRLHQEDASKVTCLTFAFSPVKDERDETQGVLCILRDTTAKVLGWDEERAKLDMLREATRLAPGSDGSV